MGASVGGGQGWVPEVNMQQQLLDILQVRGGGWVGG